MTAILMVEDHPIFAQALQRVLRERGNMDVIAIAESAEEALQKVSELELDLVLVDVSLPQKSGISLVLVLHEQYPELPCVMLSGHLSQHYARTSLAAGARGYLIKDHASEIVVGIERVLQGEIYVSEDVR
ncbi:MAG TPA: response regulator transcription factor [Anaerolineales bacterium]|jgi:DNA-binding NarL/FixJ family response regulator|nr:response regulator transcription factor [Anaerolineales bacterium]